MIVKNLQNCTTEELQELQKKSLEILVYFKEFCNEHNINFFLIGGSCIGALRHQGFIPWDDDIDVALLRDDYEKLHEVWEKYGNHENYALCRTTKDKIYHHSASQLKNNNTTFINKCSKNEDINHGIYIDVDVLDYRPSSKFQMFVQDFFALVYSLFKAQRVPDSRGKFLRYLAAFLLGVCPLKNIRYYIFKFAKKRMMKYKPENCKYVSEMIIGPKAMKRLMPKEWFTKTKMAKFEGYEMPIPDGAEQWMTMIFGNYMEFPPVGERKAKHEIILMDTENSYKKYKGKYYCVNNKKED